MTIQNLYVILSEGKKENGSTLAMYVIHCCVEMSAGWPYIHSNAKIQKGRGVDGTNCGS
jgi:hypothetical protein